MLNHILAAVLVTVVSVTSAGAFDVKNSIMPGNVPSLTDGEIATNRADGRFFYKSETGAVLGGLLPDIDTNGYLKFRNGMTLGRIQAGKYTSTPDVLQITGSTSDLSQIDLYTAPPAKFSGMARRPIFSYLPVVGGNHFDNARAQGYIEHTTEAGAGYFESGLVINARLNKGYAAAWVINTATAAGQEVFGTNGDVYVATTAGTTKGSRPNCPTVNATCLDGTGGVTWRFVQVSAYYGKAAVATFVQVDAGAATAGWGHYLNFQIGTGVGSRATFAHEIDMRNDDLDCAVGQRSCGGLLLAMNGNFKSTFGINITGQNQSAPATHIGLLLNGLLADFADISNESSAPVGFGFGLLGATAHSDSAIKDNSTGDYGVRVTGTKTIAAFASPGFQVDPVGNVTSGNKPVSTQYGGWTTYVPTLTCDIGGAPPTLSSPTGRYQVVSKKVDVEIRLPISAVNGCTSGTARASLPPGLVPTDEFILFGRETGVTGLMLQGALTAGGTSAAIVAYDNSGAVGAGRRLVLNGSYETP